MSIYRAEVLGSEQITPGMIRITLGGLTGFLSTGVGDEYIRIFLPRAGQREPALPTATDAGWEYPAGVEPSPMRTYTVRDASAEEGTIVVDFVVHQGGIAAAWAQRAAPGDVVGLNSPTGLYDPPPGIQWQILLADLTGLPAAARLIEQAPEGVRTRAVIEVPDEKHRQNISCSAGTELAWVYGGNGHGQSRLEEIIRSIELPAGPGYIWFAGETKVLRGIRKYLRHERGLPSSAYKVIGYWTDGQELWDARWENLDAQTKTWLEKLWDDEQRDSEEIEDEYFAKLESLGL